MNLAEEIRGTQVPPDHLGICWLGQAGFLLKAPDGTSMVLDPYLTECGERIRGFKRLSPMLIAPEELAVDYYVTSHLHFDHFDYDAIPIVAQCTKGPCFSGLPAVRRSSLNWAYRPTAAIVWTEENAIRMKRS